MNPEPFWARPEAVLAYLAACDRLRQEQHITEREFCREAQVSTSTITNLRHGRQRPTINTARAIWRWWKRHAPKGAPPPNI